MIHNAFKKNAVLLGKMNFSLFTKPTFLSWIPSVRIRGCDDLIPHGTSWEKHVWETNFLLGETHERS